jgi:hypothetical protein
MSEEFPTIETKIPASSNGSGAQESDLFNPERLRLSQNFTELSGVRKLITTVPVQKPHRQSFIRVHPEPEYRLDTLVLQLREEQREIYLVDPSLAAELPGELEPVTLFTAITRQNVLFLWPVRLPDPDSSRALRWHTSARLAAETAMKGWVRVAANMAGGFYDVYAATGDLPGPEWPDKTFGELLKIAFADRFIRSMDHPVMLRLRGVK